MFKRTTTTINIDTGETKELESYFSYWNDEKGYLFKSRARSLNFSDEEFPSGFSFIEKGMLFELMHYIYKDSNILSKRTKHGIRPLNTKDMLKILGLEKSQVYKLINKLIEHSILARVKIEVGSKTEIQYWLNPFYFLSGKYVSPTLYFVFRDYLKNLVPDYIRDKFEEQDVTVRNINGKKVKER